MLEAVTPLGSFPLVQKQQEGSRNEGSRDGRRGRTPGAWGGKPPGQTERAHRVIQASDVEVQAARNAIHRDGEPGERSTFREE